MSDPLEQFAYPTCEENPLFCEDEDFEDLPEADKQDDIGGKP